MKTILKMLTDGDAAPLPCLLEIWGVKAKATAKRETTLAQLAEAMIDPERVDRVLESLSPAERQALQLVLKARDGYVLEAFFRATNGDIREMGEGAVQREQPHLMPKTSAEALFYRGLVGRAFDLASSGAAQRVVYVPIDLIGLLVNMKTSYDDAADAPLPPDEDADPIGVEALPDMTPTRPADTSLVDDLTTLLAYIQLAAPPLSDLSLPDDHAAYLRSFLLNDDPLRFLFLFRLAYAADLIAVAEGQATIKRAEARRWLSATRAEQVKMLASSWKESQTLVELWMIPELRVQQQAGTMPHYDPRVGRAAVLELLAQHAPPDAWWALDEFIHVVYATRRYFQRQDFTTWYITDAAGAYLSGEESWEAVDGGLIEYLIAAPMHWLGLVDLADDAARLTAYGRGLLGMAAFPAPPDPTDKITVSAEGDLLISRRIARIDRFTAARFCSWGTPARAADNTPYQYRLDAAGLEMARTQGITPDQIGAFLQRTADAALPPTVTRLLEKGAVAPVMDASIESMVVLRTTAKRTLDIIYDTPELRRFCGARLGDTAAALRADQVEAAQAALVAFGIKITLMRA